MPVDEVIVVDNDPERSAAGPVARAHPDARLLALDNPGHAVACNRAAERAEGELLLFLDPDAALEPDALERLLEVLEREPRAALASPQLLFPDRRSVNAGDNPVHLTGLSWCGRYGEPPEEGFPRPVLTTSGACHLVRADAFRQVGGYCEEFFVLYDDPDLCWRLWLAGHEVWFVPAARGVHDYEFGTKASKWFYLERHRLLSVLTNYRVSTLAVLAPLLAGTELALLVVAGREGWRAEKLRAYRSVWELRGWIRQRRARLAALRVRRDDDLIGRFQEVVDSPQVQSGVARRAAPLLRAYAAGARTLVRALGR